jgi:hypothetical protein
VDGSEFALDLRRRVREARQALDQARAEGDFYAVDVRAGELDSLIRVAMENGIDLDEVHGVAADRGGDR